MHAEILAATVIPAALCLTTAYLLTGQSGRHSAGLIDKRPTNWTPLTARVRAGVAHYATVRFEDRTCVNTVNNGGVR